MIAQYRSYFPCACQVAAYGGTGKEDWRVELWAKSITEGLSSGSSGQKVQVKLESVQKYCSETGCSMIRGTCLFSFLHNMMLARGPKAPSTTSSILGAILRFSECEPTSFPFQDSVRTIQSMLQFAICRRLSSFVWIRVAGCHSLLTHVRTPNLSASGRPHLGSMELLARGLRK